MATTIVSSILLSNLRHASATGEIRSQFLMK